MCLPDGQFEVTILPDGNVRVVTGAIGGPEHMAAEKFMAFLARELGGETKVEKLPQEHHHHHGQHQHQKNRG